MKKVLFIDEVHHVLKEELEAMGFHCDDYISRSRHEILEILHDYFGVVIRSKFIIDKTFLDHAINLKFIARAGSGMENINTHYAGKKGIHCINSPEGNRDAVGEHTLGMLIAMLNKFVSSDQQVRQGFWDREANRGTEIKGKVVAIIGYGNMGSAFAQRLKGFDAEVIAYDKYKNGFSSDHVREVSMDEVYKKADILSLHVPLTEETEYMVNIEYLNKFAKPIYLINTARGKVIRTEHLAEMIRNGKVLGAALDVMEYESVSFDSFEEGQLPEVFRFLASSPNVLLTPHVAGWTNESKYKLAQVLAKKVKELFV